MLGFGKTFHGGHAFKRLKGELTSPVKEAEIPEKVLVPLRQGVGEEVLPLVKVGDKVKAGQLIGASDSISSPIHATITGVVASFTKIIDEFGRTVTAASIEGNEQTGEFARIAGFAPDFLRRKPEDIRVLLYRSGASSLGRRGIPTQFRSSPIPLSGVKCVVVTAIHSLPFSLNNQVFLKQRTGPFLKGLAILNHALNGVHVFVAINANDRELIATLQQSEAKHKWLKIVPLKPRYPQENEALLFKALFPRLKEKERKTWAEGAVILDPQDVVHVCEAVVEGKPVIDRIVALGGTGYVQNFGYKVRIGTMADWIVEGQVKKELNYRVVVGNFLADKGQKPLAFPITKSTRNITAIEEPGLTERWSFLKFGLDRESYSNTFLAKIFPFFQKRVDTGLNGTPHACIACGYCEEVCPAGLVPIHLSQLVEKGSIQAALRHRLDACIDCGLCSFVCPSKIPLLTHLQTGKEKWKTKG